MSLINNEQLCPSGISECFFGKTVFLTGSTGMVGQLILEKLLRTCSGIKKIYVMIREKKGKTAEERFEKLFDNVLFDQVRAVNPNYGEKVRPINGDNSIEDLNMSSEDIRRLINEVNIVIHCSADVRFNAPIKSMMYSNVRSTRDLLMLAKKMPHLQVFIYVSTAYSNCPNEEIREVIYKPSLTADNLLNLIETFDDDFLEKLTPSLIGEWPNTYAYSKHIAESVLELEGKGLPVAIVRPSIVANTYKEPLEGWVNNIFGQVGVTLVMYMGLGHTFVCKKDFVVDVMPADYLVNLILAVAWKLRFFKKPGDDEIQVYNCVSSVQNPLLWKDGLRILLKNTKQLPSTLMFWYPCFLFTSSRTLFAMLDLIVHMIPAYVGDFIARCIGKKPIAVKSYKKFIQFSEKLEYFTTRQWRFSNKNTVKLWSSLSDKDKQTYPFDATLFNWDDLLRLTIRGLRIFILKDSLATLPNAKRKYLRLKALHYGLTALLLFGLLYLICSFIIYIS